MCCCKPWLRRHVRHQLNNSPLPRWPGAQRPAAPPSRVPRPAASVPPTGASLQPRLLLWRLEQPGTRSWQRGATLHMQGKEDNVDWGCRSQINPRGAGHESAPVTTSSCISGFQMFLATHKRASVPCGEPSTATRIDTIVSCCSLSKVVNVHPVSMRSVSDTDSFSVGTNVTNRVPNALARQRRIQRRRWPPSQLNRYTRSSPSSQAATGERDGGA